MSLNQMRAVKRDGTTKETIDPNKINQWLEWACEGTDVAWSELASHIHIQFYDDISTADIHKITVKAASDLISEEEPDYQSVAGKLVQAGLRKQVYGRFEPLSFLDNIHRCQEAGVYDSESEYALTNLYSDEELIELGHYVNHERDFMMTYAGAQQFIDKYLVQDRATGEIFETPQYAFMACIATLMGPSTDIMTREERLTLTKQSYDDYTLHKCSEPTPILSGVRTPMRRHASCCLFEFGDSINSIDAAESVAFKMTASRSGLGLYIGGMRAEGDRIRGGEVGHTGLIPFLRRTEATTGSCTQNGVRGGGGTVTYPMWHRDFESLVVLKNTEGGDEVRVTALDHCFFYDGYLLNRYLVQRQIDSDPNHPDKDKPRQVLSFFSPRDVPGLEDAFSSSDRNKFKELYEKYENDPRIPKIKKDVIVAFNTLWVERIKTGRVYWGHVDHINTHSSFNVNIKMTNLCFSGDTLVATADTGKYISIKQLADESQGAKQIAVKSSEWKGNKWEVVDSTAVAFSNGVHDLIELGLSDGRSFKCTSCHELATPEGIWIEAHQSLGEELQADFMTPAVPEDEVEAALEGVFVTAINEVDPEEVYDLTVPVNSNFYILPQGSDSASSQSILVHNCTEITLPTEEIPHALDLYGYDSDPEKPEAGEIALCILGGIAWGFCEKDEMRGILYRAALALDNLIDMQDYEFAPAERNAKRRRNIGIGPMNVAYLLAKHGYKYWDREAATLVHQWAESMQYYLLEASVDLAQKRGACEWFNQTKYSQGLLPIDHYKKNVDDLHDAELQHDWEGLRAKIARHGLRFSTHTAGMPGESSSVVINATNSHEPPLGPVGSKTSRRRSLPFVVPGFKEYKNSYTWAYDMGNNSGYRAITAVMQKFFDQSISYNQYYDYTKIPDGKLDFDEVVMDQLNDYKYGIKTGYYLNTNVHQSDDSLVDSCSGPELHYEGPELPETDIRIETRLEENGCGSGSCGI